MIREQCHKQLHNFFPKSEKQSFLQQIDIKHNKLKQKVYVAILHDQDIEQEYLHQETNQQHTN